MKDNHKKERPYICFEGQEEQFKMKKQWTEAIKQEKQYHHGPNERSRELNYTKRGKQHKGPTCDEVLDMELEDLSPEHVRAYSNFPCFMSTKLVITSKLSLHPTSSTSRKVRHQHCHTKTKWRELATHKALSKGKCEFTTTSNSNNQEVEST